MEEGAIRPSLIRWKMSYFNDEVFRTTLLGERYLIGLGSDHLVSVLSGACDT